MDKNDSYLNMEYIKKPDALKNQGSGTFKERAADGNRTLSSSKNPVNTGGLRIAPRTRPFTRPPQEIHIL